MKAECSHLPVSIRRICSVPTLKTTTELHTNVRYDLYTLLPYRPPLAAIHTDLCCIFCGIALVKDVNWRLHHESGKRPAYCCRDHEKLRTTPKLNKQHHCRLCGCRLIPGFNFEESLASTYVCHPCLYFRTCEFVRLRYKRKRLAQFWERNTMVHLAVAYTKEVEPLGAGKVWSSRLLPPLRFLLTCMEFELQYIVARAISRHTRVEVLRECSLPRGGVVDIVVPALRLVIEMKRSHRMRYNQEGMPYSPAPFMQFEEETGQQQRDRYQRQLDEVTRELSEETWEVMLVSPDGSVPGSIDCNAALSKVVQLCHSQSQEG